MEISCIESYILEHEIPAHLGDSRTSINHRYWVIVEIHTDDGTSGTGWMGTWRSPEVFHDYLERDLAKVLVGRNPLHIESIREKLRQETLYYPGELGMSAHPRGAIDVALWDIKAKYAGSPLYELLGGDSGRVPIYMSCLDAGLDHTELTQLYSDGREEGYTAFKTKVGNNPIAYEEERLQTIRDAIGERAFLRIDANQAWTPKEAVATVDVLEKYDIDWVEEPISEYDMAGYERVSQNVEVAIASGEMFYHPFRFRQLFVNGGIDIAQPDLIRIGGVSGQLKIANLAAAFDVPIAPHLYPSISAHVASAVPNGMCVERIPGFDITSLLESPPVVRDGQLELPDSPGHGFRISPEAKDEHQVL